jgi:hypothetical protein
MLCPSSVSPGFCRVMTAGSTEGEIMAKKNVSLVSQVPLDEADDRWYDVADAIPSLDSGSIPPSSATVLVWCGKYDAVFAGSLIQQPEGLFWHTRSLDGSVLADIQHHVTHVRHWRPIPPAPRMAR